METRRRSTTASVLAVRREREELEDVRPRGVAAVHLESFGPWLRAVVELIAEHGGVERASSGTSRPRREPRTQKRGDFRLATLVAHGGADAPLFGSL